MKKLYLRFFEHKDGCAIDSVELDTDDVYVGVNENCGRISDFLASHPDGKIDIIWSNF